MPGAAEVLGCGAELDTGEEEGGVGVEEEGEKASGVEEEGKGEEDDTEVIGAVDKTIEEDIEEESVADEAIVDGDNGEVGAGVSEAERKVVVTAGGVKIRDVDSKRGLGSADDVAIVSGNCVGVGTAVSKSLEPVTAGDTNNAVKAYQGQHN